MKRLLALTFIIFALLVASNWLFVDEPPPVTEVASVDNTPKKIFQSFDSGRRKLDAYFGGHDGKLTSEETATALVRLKSPDTFERRRAVWDLQRIQPNDESTVDPLIEALDDPDQSVSYYAAQALGRTRSPRAVPALVERLEGSTDLYMQAYAVRALGRLGSLSTSAVPALTKAVAHKNKEFAKAAAIALQRVGSADAHKALETEAGRRAAAYQPRYYP